MACGKDDGSQERLSIGTLDATDCIALNEKGGHTGLEMDFTTALQDGLAHVLDDARQAVGSDMGVGIDQNIGVGTMLHEDTKDLLAVATFLAAGVELAVAIGSGSPFPKGVVALGIHALVGTDAGNVLLALVDISPTLYHNGAIPQFDEAEGCEKSTGTGTYHHHRGAVADIVICDGDDGTFLGLLVDENTDGKVDENRTMASIDTTLQNTDGRTLYPLLMQEIGLYGTFVESVLR